MNNEQVSSRFYTDDDGQPSSQLVITGERAKSQFVAELTAGVVVPSLAIAVTQIILLIKNGYSQIELITLIAASISIFVQTIEFYSVVADAQNQRKKPSCKTMVLSFLGAIPTGFGALTCLYKGVWSLKDVYFNFSVSSLLLSIMFIFLGGKVFNASQRVEKLINNIVKQKVVFEP